jgi:type II secretory pathway pseudopilin PulG
MRRIDMKNQIGLEKNTPCPIMKSSGFSLVEVTVAIGIGAVFMAAIIGGMSIGAKQRRFVDQATETSLLSDQIRLAILKPAACSTNMNNGTNVIDPDVETPITMPDFAPATVVARDLTIKSMTIQVNKNARVDVHPANTIPPGQTYDRYPATIKVQTSLDTGGEAHVSGVRTVQLYVNVDPVSKKIMGCESDNGDQGICQQTGGTWDAAAPFGEQCIPVDHCETAGSFNFLDPAQGGFVNYRTGATSCPIGYTAQRTGTMQFAKYSAKYNVQNLIYPTYTCTRCPGVVGADPATVPHTVPDVNGAFDFINGEAAAAQAADANANDTEDAIATDLSAIY